MPWCTIPIEVWWSREIGCLDTRYLKKLLSPKAWIRFLLLKSDFRIMFKSLLQPIVSKSSGPSKQSMIQNNGNSNPYFSVAFYEIVSSRKVLLIFSEADRLYWEFEEKFMQPYGEGLKKYEDNVEIYIVESANHIFSFL